MPKTSAEGLEIYLLQNHREQKAPINYWGFLFMKKEFDEWNQKKKWIENRSVRFFFQAREIWWCSVGLNIKEESCGKGDSFRRPVLIIKKLSANNFIGLPLSTQKRNGSWFAMIKINNQNQFILLHQIKMFSVNRLQWRLTTIDKNDFIQIKEKLKTLLEFS